MPLLRESIYEGIVIAMCQIVEVLDANDSRGFSGLPAVAGE